VFALTQHKRKSYVQKSQSEFQLKSNKLSNIYDLSNPSFEDNEDIEQCSNHDSCAEIGHDDFNLKIDIKLGILLKRLLSSVIICPY
jgi:hypothetical protein